MHEVVEHTFANGMQHPPEHHPSPQSSWLAHFPAGHEIGGILEMHEPTLHF